MSIVSLKKIGNETIEMDVIESLDWGVYSHFRFQSQQHPDVLPSMQAAYYLSSYAGVSVLMTLAASFFLLRRRPRSALVVLVSFVTAIGLIEAMRFLVPRRRPEDAEIWLGRENMVGSYPSSGVFLFMLGLIFIGSAIWELAPKLWQRGAYVFTAAVLSVWVCVSQFFLSINFLTDVLGGMAGATLISWIASRFLVRDDVPKLAAPSDAIQDLSRLHGIQGK